ncbi:MAG TPA: hypothetical protein VJ792_06620 [Candidatus Nitrosotalea sp.]|nr:hypothetical protein [Candidatus Nitrosotalea sp.]
MSQQNQLRKTESRTPESVRLSSMEFVGSSMNPCCTFCGAEVGLVEGDVIYGKDWYHSSCWKAADGRSK